MKAPFSLLAALMRAPASTLVASALAATVVIGTASPAFAGASLKLASKTLEEKDEKWKLQMTINLGSPPHMPHVPMNFTFVPTAHTERTLTDESPETPIIRRIPLQNQQPIIKSMDVGFSDGMGKVWPSAKFDFVITRAHGFEAGEYTLEVKTSEGQSVGGKQSITLKGDNPIVDRRAMVFSGKKKEKKEEAPKDDAAKEEKKSEDGEKPAGDKAAENAEGTEAAAGPASASAHEEPDNHTSEDASGPPSVPPHQGGCGCRVQPEGAPALPTASGVAALMALGLVVRRRDRKRARRAGRAAR